MRCIEVVEDFVQLYKTGQSPAANVQGKAYRKALSGAMTGLKIVKDHAKRQQEAQEVRSLRS
jgi:hypothetical protein